jgi:hypothetical protein
MGINGAISAKKWHFRRMNALSRNRPTPGITKHPQGIRTRAATLKGWVNSECVDAETTDQRQYSMSKSCDRKGFGHTTGINEIDGCWLGSTMSTAVQRAERRNMRYYLPHGSGW